jgi:hypothetical protein
LREYILLTILPIAEEIGYRACWLGRIDRC